MTRQHRLTAFLAALVVPYLAACNNDSRGEDDGSLVTKPGTTYYVDASVTAASDQNDGRSLNTPWKTIQKAASTLQAGDIAYVRAGTYFESGIQFKHSGKKGSPIVLSAYKQTGTYETVVLEGSTQASPGPGLLFRDGRSHVEVRGFTIENMGDAGIVSDADTSNRYRGIVIRDVTVRKNMQGVRLSCVENFTLENLKVYDNGGDGILIGSETDLLDSRSGSIKKCAVYRNEFGIHLVKTTKSTLESNSAYENVVSGFFLDQGSNENTLRKNIAYKNQQVDGFTIGNSHSNLIQDNEAYENGKRGLQLTGGSKKNTVSGNTAYNNRILGFAIYVNATENTMTGNTAYGNKFHGFVFLGGAKKNVVSNNLSYSNKRCGFYAENAHENVFKDNTLHDNARHGFVLVAGSSQNTVSGNKVYKNGRCGIFAQGAPSNTIKGNTSYENVLDGFALLFDSADNLLTNNTSKENKGWGYLTEIESSQSGLPGTNIALQNIAGALGTPSDSWNATLYTDYNDPE